MTLDIRLDPQGEPHWLSELRAWKRWLRRQRYAILFYYLRWRESREFYRKHGPVISVEDMPRQPRRPARPRKT